MSPKLTLASIEIMAWDRTINDTISNKFDFPHSNSQSKHKC